MKTSNKMKRILIIALVCVNAVSFAQIPNYVPSSGLVGWWPFNGNANDESGNGNNGFVNGATLTADRHGNVNSAYYFDNNKIEVAHNANLGIQQHQGFTVSLWAKKNAGSLNTHLMGKRPSGAQNFNWHIADWEGTQFSSTSAPNVFGALSNQPVDTSSWMNIIGVYNNDTWSLYLNGSLTVSSTTVYFFPDVNTPLVFGNSGDWGCYLGKMDDIGIWNRALSSCEINDLYHEQLHFTTINAGQNQNTCFGDQISLVGSGANFLTWNNNVIDGIPFTPIQTSSYVLTGSDALGCVQSDTVVVTVLQNSSNTINQSATDNYTWPINGQTYTQSGVYTDTLINSAGCDSIITLNLALEFTGLNEFNKTNVLISPSPITNQFSISGIEEIVSLTIMDMNGKIVKTLNEKEKSHDVSNLKPGMYFLDVRDENRSYRIKVMKD